LLGDLWCLIYGFAEIVVSITLLYVSSKRVVEYASKLAHALNLNKLYIGAVIVASITALPELITSIAAVIYGSSSHMALGNVIGSNIYNIPVVIGFCGLLMKKLEIDGEALKRESLILLSLSILLMCFLLVLHRLTSWVASIFLTIYPIYIYRFMKLADRNILLANGGCTHRCETIKNLVATIASGVTLIISAHILVYGVLTVADALGLNRFYAGVNILSLGCIIPEIAVSISAAFRNEHNIAFGNIIGDNIITMTLVIGVVGLVAQPEVAVMDVIFTIPLMSFVAILPLIISRYGGSIRRIHGLAIMVFTVVLYIVETILLA
jgi:cation:H+ antiporter